MTKWCHVCYWRTVFVLLLYGKHFEAIYIIAERLPSVHTQWQEKLSKLKKIVCLVYLLFLWHLFTRNLHNIHIPQVLHHFWMSIMNLIFQSTGCFLDISKLVCVYLTCNSSLKDFFVSLGAQCPGIPKDETKLSIWTVRTSLQCNYLDCCESVKEFGFLLSGTVTSSSKPLLKYKHNHQNSSLAFVFFVLFHCHFLDFGKKRLCQ